MFMFIDIKQYNNEGTFLWLKFTLQRNSHPKRSPQHCWVRVKLYEDRIYSDCNNSPKRCTWVCFLFFLLGTSNLFVSVGACLISKPGSVAVKFVQCFWIVCFPVIAVPSVCFKIKFIIGAYLPGSFCWDWIWVLFIHAPLWYYCSLFRVNW